MRSENQDDPWALPPYLPLDPTQYHVNLTSSASLIEC